MRQLMLFEMHDRGTKLAHVAPPLPKRFLAPLGIMVRWVPYRDGAAWASEAAIAMALAIGFLPTEVDVCVWERSPKEPPVVLMVRGIEDAEPMTPSAAVGFMLDACRGCHEAAADRTCQVCHESFCDDCEDGHESDCNRWEDHWEGRWG